MKIHKEGHRLIIVSLLLNILIGILIYELIPIHIAIKVIIFLGLAVYSILIIRFFRMPLRVLHDDPLDIICPADGKVVVLENVTNTEYFGDEKIQVSVFMSPNDIHVNWFPLGGVIKYVKYYPGKYFVAWHPKSSLLNERTTVVIENENGTEILVKQIAGAVARRVVCYAETGKRVNAGDELGFIKFGSRVDLLLPTDCEIKVNIDDKVRGRETVIARLKK